MEDGRLWGNGHRPIKPAEILRVYGAVLPLFVDYVRNELIENHVHPRGRAYAREDALKRADELIGEALKSEAEAKLSTRRGQPGQTRRRPGKARPAGLRRRRAARLPQGRSLLRQYESLMVDLRKFLPRRRRGEPLSRDAFRAVQERFPELGWKRRRASVGATPARTALELIGRRYGVEPSAVLAVVRQARARLA